MLGLLFKIGFGRRIDWQNVVGTIVGFARFANKPKSPTTTSSSIAASRQEFENF
jgi:hypothetical protein